MVGVALGLAAAAFAVVGVAVLVEDAAGDSELADVDVPIGPSHVWEFEVGARGARGLCWRLLLICLLPFLRVQLRLLVHHDVADILVARL